MFTKLLKKYPHLLAGVCFLLLTVAMPWPVATRLNTHVTPGQQPVMTVPYLNLWTLAWNHHWLTGQAENYWDTNQFYPHQQTLAYSEPQFAMGLLTVALTLLGANTVLTYNLLLLGFVWGAGMTVYALCWYLFQAKALENSTTKGTRCYPWAASVTAGILYGFHFYIFAELGVLQLLTTLFPPLTLLGLHRFLNTNKWTDALLFCSGFLGCWYTCAYYGLFLSVFVCCFVLKFGYRKVLEMEWKTCIRGVVTALITLLGLLPLIGGMQSAKTAMELSRPKLAVRDLSAGISDYLKFPKTSWLYGKILEIGSPDGRIFLGVMLVSLAAIGTVFIFRKSTARKTDEAQINTALFPKHHGKFYLIMAGLAFWLSCGMAVTPTNAAGLGVYRIIAWLSPYNLLYQYVPGFSSIRSPYRFAIFCALFLAVLAGWGMLYVLERSRPQWRAVLMPILVICVLFEHWPLPARLVSLPSSSSELPRIYEHVKKLPADATFIELPLARGHSEQQLETQAQAIYASTFHWRRIANGYSGFTPRAHLELNQMIAESDSDTLMSALKVLGIQYVLTHEEELNENEKQKLMALQGDGLMPIAHEGEKRLYQVVFNATKPPALPITEGLTFYESRTSQDSVTLCLYYQMDVNQCQLITPWKRKIEYDVAWYSRANQSELILVSTGTCRNSQLLTKTSNVIEINLPAPPPGEYRVVVKPRSAVVPRTTLGICRIHESGFVTFESIL